MNGLLISELLLYIGGAAMCLAAVAGIVCLIGFRASGKRIKRILEQEYGVCPK